MAQKHITIAIDGPAGAGKSSVAKRLAVKLGCIYVDTGALYRTIAFSAIKYGIDPKDSEKIIEHLKCISVDIKYIDGKQVVLLGEDDVSDFIRTPEVSEGASVVSALPEVRAFLLDTQRNLAKKQSVVMDGRDIATVVLPDATVKIFLTASAEERANRRFKELLEKGTDVKYEEVLADIKARDYRDSNRAVAPLKQAEGAVLIDTTELNFEQSVEALENAVAQVLAKDE